MAIPDVGLILDDGLVLLDKELDGLLLELVSLVMVRVDPAPQLHPLVPGQGVWAGVRVGELVMYEWCTSVGEQVVPSSVFRQRAS